jgi:hypothetical protein
MNEGTAAYRSERVFMLFYGFFFGCLIFGMVLGMVGFTVGYFVYMATLSAGCLGSVLAFKAVKA